MEQIQKMLVYFAEWKVQIIIVLKLFQAQSDN